MKAAQDEEDKERGERKQGGQLGERLYMNVQTQGW